MADLGGCPSMLYDVMVWGWRSREKESVKIAPAHLSREVSMSLTDMLRIMTEWVRVHKAGSVGSY